MSDEDPKFCEVDLTELIEAGVLLAVNERVLWPLGLALAWTWDWTAKRATNLRVRQWEFGDGHLESIQCPPDALSDKRHWALEAYVQARAAKMPAEEGKAALKLIDPKRY